VTCCVLQHENHVESSWLGGSVLSALSIFPALAITREEFIHDGINAILRHMEI
jgi:actin-related protein